MPKIYKKEGPELSQNYHEHMHSVISLVWNQKVGKSNIIITTIEYSLSSTICARMHESYMETGDWFLLTCALCEWKNWRFCSSCRLTNNINTSKQLVKHVPIDAHQIKNIWYNKKTLLSGVRSLNR